MERGERRAPVDPQGRFHQPARGFQLDYGVGDGGHRSTQLAQKLIATQEPVSPEVQVQWVVVQLSGTQLGLGSRVDLHHLDTMWTNQRADAAARAVV